jgi:hypothetical protein
VDERDIDERELLGAVRRVATAVQVIPESVEIPPGLIRRARRRGTPAMLALKGPDLMLVVLGRRQATDPGDCAEAAFEALPPDTRAACKELIVGWGADHGVRVAVFTIRESGPVRDPVATSWTGRDSWPRPTVDGVLRGEQAIASALDGLRAALASSVPAAVERAVETVGLELRAQGGEPVDAVAPDASSSAVVRERWLERYARTVRGEWRRATGKPGSPTDTVRLEPAPSGPLRGWTVFVSYARPDAVTLAWPVADALAEAGATVWLDQAENPDAQLLDAGLADLIARCDAYVACVSNEFFERAGYATQELAWAIERSNGSQAHVLVAKPGTVVPRIVARWPGLLHDGRPDVDLVRPLVDGLLGASARVRVELPQTQEQEPVLDDAIDVGALRRRLRHVQRFLDIGQGQFEAIATGQPDDRTAQVARQLLLDPGAGLEWSGHLHDISEWPEDPLVRDMRWRIGVMRVVASVRWPLSGSLDEPVDIADDMDRMLLYRHPALEWPSVAGWADDERRLAVRYHVGLLRLLGELLERGLYGGLLGVVDARRTAWETAVVERRQECVDALVDLRLRRRLGWHADRPTWDGVYRRMLALLRAPRGGWREAVPGPVDALVRSAGDDVAAAAAETFWVFARTGQTTSRPVPLRGRPTARLLAWAGWDVPARPATALGLTPGPDGGIEFLVAWPDPMDPGVVRQVRVRDADFAEQIRFTS